MSVYRRIPLQFIFQALRIGLHAYLLGGGHSRALDQGRGGADDPRQQGDSGGILGAEVWLDPDHSEWSQPGFLDNDPQSRADRGNAAFRKRLGQPGYCLVHQRAWWQRPGRRKVYFYRHDEAASAQRGCVSPQDLGRVGNIHEHCPLDHGIERPAWRRVVNVALKELHLR